MKIGDTVRRIKARPAGGLGINIGDVGIIAAKTNIPDCYEVTWLRCGKTLFASGKFLEKADGEES